MMYKACAIATMIVALSAAPAVAKDQVGLVSFTFDDGSISQYANAFRIMESYDLPATLYVVTGYLDGTVSGLREPLSWRQVKQMHAAGWEIGGHTHSHPYLTELSDIQLFAELAYSYERVTKVIGVPPVSFASPYGEFNDTVVREIRQHFNSHARAWGGNEGVNSIPMKDPYDIGRLEIRREDNAAAVCSVINKAATEGDWLVLLFHHVVNGEPEEFAVSSTVFGEIVACAASLQKAGELRVLTVTQALEVMDTD